MKLCKTKEEYIEYVAPFAQRACKRFGNELGKPFYLPSVLVAQACHENGFSLDPKAQILVTVNNMCGIKKNLLNPSWTDVGLGCWDGEFINKETPEVYGGVPTTIYDDFREYRDVEQSFMDYLCFMRWGGYSVGNPKYYPHIKDLHDYRSLAKTVHNLGYATGTTYSDALIKKVEDYNLTRFDDLSNVEPSAYWPSAAKEVKEVNSPLVSYTKLSPCNSGQRTMPIDRITPHCVVGQLSVETIGSCFDHSSVQASCNYGIGSDGRVMLCVPENVRSWCSSSSANDQRAVTIECACDKTAPYAFKDVVYQKLIELCTDICRRNGKKKLLWFGQKEYTLSYKPAADEMVLTVHRWFANKACPGDWMFARMGDLASKVTAALGGSSTPSGNNPNDGAKKLYRVQVGAYKQRSNAEIKLRQISATGTDCFITELQEGYYRVQCGAYSVKSNAEAKMNSLKYMGFDAIIKEYDVA